MDSLLIILIVVLITLNIGVLLFLFKNTRDSNTVQWISGPSFWKKKEDPKIIENINIPWTTLNIPQNPGHTF